jgi:hypothetical protein
MDELQMEYPGNVRIASSVRALDDVEFKNTLYRTTGTRYYR